MKTRSLIDETGVQGSRDPAVANPDSIYRLTAAGELAAGAPVVFGVTITAEVEHALSVFDALLVAARIESPLLSPADLLGAVRQALVEKRAS